MKNIILKSSIFAVSLLFMVGCGEDFLTKDNLFEKSLESYYRTPADIDEALIGAYSMLSVDNGHNEQILISNIQSDDHFGCGGTNDSHPDDMDKQNNQKANQYSQVYEGSYAGIFRINMLLSKFDQATYEDEELKKQNFGEAHFLRAFYYFRLAQLFGEVPLNMGTELQYLAKSPAAEIYAQVVSDLKVAIDNLPATAWTQDWSNANNGRATKWAAQALMARIYLFYTGYYKAELPGVTKAEVVSMIEDCIANSGHAMLPDFENQWPYSYIMERDSVKTVNGNYAKWAKDGNQEVVWAITHSNQADWGNKGLLRYSNSIVLFNSIRGGDPFAQYGQGWGFAQINPKLIVTMGADPRKDLSILDCQTDPDIVATGKWKFNIWDSQEETGLYNKKYNSVGLKNAAGVWEGLYYALYGGLAANSQLWNMQDKVIIRFADVLLMHSELTGDATNLNKVRARVGLPAVAYSIDAVKQERHFEFVGEGLRYYDLLRWGDAKTAIEKCNGAQVYHVNAFKAYSVTFNPDRAFLPLPESEIELSQGKLEQNPGWK